MHQRGTDVEVFVYGILEVKAEQGLALCVEQALVLKGDADALPRVYDALVGDGHYAHGVVHGIIRVIHELHASGHYYY